MTIAKKITRDDVGMTGATGLCTGANLRTPCGERRVEFLRTGDLIVTRDNGLQPVRFIWEWEVSETEMAADPSLAPVVLEPRVIGPMMPQKILRVGGAHRLLIPGWRLEDEEDTENCLVPARDVEGLWPASETPSEPVTYYNIVFDVPQVFCANGMPVESFTPSETSLTTTPDNIRDQLQCALPDYDSDFAEYPEPAYRKRERVSYTPNYA